MISSRRSARLVGLAALLVVPVVAQADSFNGVAGNEKAFLIGPARICTPLPVTGGNAKGMPACRAAPADEVAGLSTRMPSAERGPKAALTAKAKGRTITVASKDGGALVAWDAPDTVASVVDVWRSPTTGRVLIVEYVVRRAGREVHDVVAFDVGLGRQPSSQEPVTPAVADPITAPVGDPVTPPVDSSALGKAVAKARKLSGKAGAKAWSAVLAVDAVHGEALYRLAALDAAGKKSDAAIARLEKLATSARPDAIEWLVAARADKAFASLVGQSGFRAAVGLDRPATSTYERVMGLGGLWEQALVPCDRPEMKLTFTQSRKLTLQLRTSCSGSRDKVTYRGTWDVAGGAVELKLPKLDTGDDIAPCALTPDHDEDVMHCQIDDDLSFDARPVRR